MGSLTAITPGKNGFSLLGKGPHGRLSDGRSFFTLCG
jgi:hypothetical protein